jgi:hypothetical protein
MGGGTGTDGSCTLVCTYLATGSSSYRTACRLYLSSRGETGDERERPGAGLEATGRERNLERGQATICRTDNVLMALSASYNLLWRHFVGFSQLAHNSTFRICCEAETAHVEHEVN